MKLLGYIFQQRKYLYSNIPRGKHIIVAGTMCCMCWLSDLFYSKAIMFLMMKLHAQLCWDTLHIWWPSDKKAFLVPQNFVGEVGGVWSVFVHNSRHPIPFPFPLVFHFPLTQQSLSFRLGVGGGSTLSPPPPVLFVLLQTLVFSQACQYLYFECAILVS